MTLETKHFAIEELKAAEAQDGTRTIEGFGSVFGNKDSYGDVVMPGAFAKSIAGRMPKMLWQHNSDQPIGVWDTVEEQKKGLYLKGRILPTALGNDAYTLLKGGAISGLSIGFTTKKYSIDTKTNTRQLEELDLYEVSPVTFPANDKATVTSVKSASDDIDTAVGFLTQACALCDSGAAMTPEVCATVCQLVQAAISLLDDPNEDMISTDATTGDMEGMSADLTERQLEKRLRDVGLSQREAKALVAGGYKAILKHRDGGAESLNDSINKAINALKGITA